MPAPRTPISRPDCAIRARAPLVGTVDAPVVLVVAEDAEEDSAVEVARTTEVEVLFLVLDTRVVVRL